MSALRFLRNLFIRAPYNLLGQINTISVRSICSSAIRPAKLRQWYRAFWKDDAPLSPPYKHCTQIGDPVLRQVTCDIPIENITEPFVVTVIEQMKQTLRAYNLVGISANQIGVSLSIMMMEYRKSYAENVQPEVFRAKEMQIVPLTIVINPKIKILNYDQKVFHEGCASVCGYTAEVPRYEEVLLTGYNEKADAVELKLKGWTARIAQHEVDHLNGKVFIDIMNRKSFTCSTWEAINAYGGKLYIPFYPKKRGFF